MKFMSNQPAMLDVLFSGHQNMPHHTTYHLNLQKVHLQSHLQPSKPHMIKEDGKVSTAKPAAASVAKNKQVAITVKHSKKLKLMDICKMLDNTFSITEHSEDSIDYWSKAFCIPTMLAGIFIHYY